MPCRSHTRNCFTVTASISRLVFICCTNPGNSKIGTGCCSWRSTCGVAPFQGILTKAEGSQKAVNGLRNAAAHNRLPSTH